MHLRCMILMACSKHSIETQFSCLSRRKSIAIYWVYIYCYGGVQACSFVSKDPPLAAIARRVSYAIGCSPGQDREEFAGGPRPDTRARCDGLSRLPAYQAAGGSIEATGSSQCSSDAVHLVPRKAAPHSATRASSALHPGAVASL